MKNIIAVIGAGQIGSRHLQGLAKLNIECEIYVLDKSEDSLKTAKARFLEIPRNPKISEIHFERDFGALPKTIDLAIVASGAEPRLKIMETALSNSNVRYMLLEKVLFQSMKEYDSAEKLLSEKKVKAWVNCPRRVWDEYLVVKEHLRNSRNTKFKVSGENWRLLSNAIHMIDLFSFLCEDYEYKLDCSALERDIAESKRIGCIEFYGKLKGTFSNGSEFELSCKKGSLSNIIFEAETPTCLVRTDMNVPLSKTELKISDKSGMPIVEQTFKMHFQSELTGKIAEDILLNGNCGLSSYEQSSKLHVPFIRTMLAHLYAISGTRHERLPAT